MQEKAKKKPGAIKRTLKSLVDVRRWMAWPEIKQGARGIGSLLKGIFTRSKVKPQDETFDEAVLRLHLTEKDLEAKKKSFLNLALIYAAIALLIFMYTVYLFIHRHIMAGLLSGLLSLLMFVYASRTSLLYGN